MTYNTDLQSHNTRLQNLINTANSLPDAGSGGVELPELTNEGTAADLMSGKQLINDEGSVVTGMFTIDSEISTQDTLIANIKTALQDKAAGGGGGSITGRQIATGSFTAEGGLYTKEISGLSFTPGSVIIEARKRVSLPGGSWNISTIALGELFDSCSAYSPSAAQASAHRVGKASTYATITFSNGGFVIDTSGVRFGNATYYWTAIEGSSTTSGGSSGDSGSSGGSV